MSVALLCFWWDPLWPVGGIVSFVAFFKVYTRPARCLSPVIKVLQRTRAEFVYEVHFTQVCMINWGLKSVGDLERP